MSALDRAACIGLIEGRYFGGVMRGDMPGIRECFAPGAKVLIRHGDQPERRFRLDAAGTGETELMEFYRHICGNYAVWFGEFRHYVDVEQQRAASTFRVRLTPRPEGLYAASAVQELSNCNFFDFSDGRIEHMIIYYSNPGAGASGAAVSPTGYPPLGKERRRQ